MQHLKNDVARFNADLCNLSLLSSDETRVSLKTPHATSIISSQNFLLLQPRYSVLLQTLIYANTLEFILSLLKIL